VIAGRSANVAEACDPDVDVVPSVTASGLNEPEVHVADAMNVPQSEVEPSKNADWPFPIFEGMVNADPAVVCIPEPAAMMIAPSIVGVFEAGASGRLPFWLFAELVVGVISIGVD
jgi:hypothetical protein